MASFSFPFPSYKPSCIPPLALYKIHSHLSLLLHAYMHAYVYTYCILLSLYYVTGMHIFMDYLWNWIAKHCVIP